MSKKNSTTTTSTTTDDAVDATNNPAVKKAMQAGTKRRPGNVVTAKAAAARQRVKTRIDFSEADDVVRDQVGGFINFIRDNGVVGLAIGFVAGTQAQAVVKSLISDFIDPATKLFFGGVRLSERTFSQTFDGRTVDFRWGNLVYTLLNLLIVLGTIYALIKVLKLDRLQKPKDVPADDKKGDKKDDKKPAKKK